MGLESHDLSKTRGRCRQSLKIAGFQGLGDSFLAYSSVELDGHIHNLSRPGRDSRAQDPPYGTAEHEVRARRCTFIASRI